MQMLDKNNIRTKVFFDHIPELVKELFDSFDFPWEVLPYIGKFINQKLDNLTSLGYQEYSKDVWLGAGTQIAPTATIVSPCIIGKNCEIRPGAYIRGNVIIGDNCVIGNSTEIKNSIIFDNAQLPHYNYVGDSVIGNYSHMGAGAVCSNQKQDKSEINIRFADTISTGLGKLGAILSDHVEVGCGSVLNPGTVIMENSRVYPLVSVRGVIPPDSIVKSTSEIVKIESKKLP